MKLWVDIPEPVWLPYKGEEVLFDAPNKGFHIHVDDQFNGTLEGNAGLSDVTFPPEDTLKFINMLMERGLKIRVVSMVTALVLAIAALFGSAPLHMAEAATATPCYVNQQDMAGIYANADFLVYIYPCNGATVQWRNDYGLHMAHYNTSDLVPGGGYILVLQQQSPYGLDGRRTVMLKPAERGYIQVVTVDVTGADIRVYRLWKEG